MKKPMIKSFWPVISHFRRGVLVQNAPLFCVQANPFFKVQAAKSPTSGRVAEKRVIERRDESWWITFERQPETESIRGAGFRLGVVFRLDWFFYLRQSRKRTFKSSVGYEFPAETKHVALFETHKRRTAADVPTGTEFSRINFAAFSLKVRTGSDLLTSSKTQTA